MPEVPPFLWSDAGVFDSPVTYTVPGTGEVQPYTATATYTNNSGQAILPALRIKSASGNLLALVFPAGQIADGDSSEVTFLPPFGSAASDTDAIRFNRDNEGGYLTVNTNDTPGLALYAQGNSPENALAIGSKDGNANVFVGSENGNIYLGGMPDGTFLDTSMYIGGSNGAVLYVTGWGGGVNVGSVGPNPVGFMQITTEGFGVESDAGVFLEDTAAGGGDGVDIRSVHNPVTVHASATHIYLQAGGSLTVYDHTNTPILSVNEAGTSYRIKTGAAWVADL